MLDRVADGSVDMVYIDPPFNSTRQFNLLFRQIKGDPSPAQIMAFEDTWTWSPSLMDEFQATSHSAKLKKLVDSLYDLLGPSEMLAYVVMMAPRLEHLSRKLRMTGSIFVHCDAVASPYLRLVLDALMDPRYFRNEIAWKRTSSHNDASQGQRRFGRTHDTILCYGRSDESKFNTIFQPYDDDYIKKHYSNVEAASGKRYKTSDLTAAKGGGDTSYDWKGAVPPKGRFWAYSRANMERFESQDRLVYAAKSGMPRLKHYLDEMPGVSLGDTWTDVPPLNSQSRERRGYATQKPTALLERIIRATTDEGDLCLDAFCGCGTTIAAAQRLGRRWVGIDVTYLAIREIEERLAEEFQLEKGTDYRVEGLPADLDAAREFFRSTKSDSHKQFEMWAVGLVGGRPREKKGADRGIDGDLLLHDPDKRLVIAPLQVKGGAMNPSSVRDFAHVIHREKAPVGGLLTLEPPTKPMEQAAADLGTIECNGRRTNRLQLLPIGHLLERKANLAIPDGFSVPPSRYRPQGILF